MTSTVTTPAINTSSEAIGARTEVKPDAGTSQGSDIIEASAPELATTQKDPYQGDGVDPSKAAALIPQRTAIEWIAYSVSLNYNRQLLRQLQREQCLEDVVNLCAEFSGHIETMQELGLVQCWIPTRDFQTPSLESIWTGVRFISKCEARWQGLDESKRGSLYIHCKAGRGRSATVALCWLLFAYKLIPEQAQLVLLKARAQVDKDIYLHSEVVSFYDQVLEQENNSDIVRIDWPDSQ
ncbi:hypothetical protein BGZ80_002740 [Entomortierella chlamydospora]|uniref:Tyrosine specific protein phosphatases domain-containing protein n=1 Tax=Entomortierella chlamydospora TaxID=101097 RepID=A0A9P6N122_9FUNG|nr:hypothetical protein BGZ80_002740 [Entomortierella chlamydospora]